MTATAIQSNIQFTTVSIKRLQILQQQLSKKKKGSANKKKQRIKVAIQHEKICNQRTDFLHKLSRFYINSYNLIAVEALEIKGIIKKHTIPEIFMMLPGQNFCKCLNIMPKALAFSW